MMSNLFHKPLAHIKFIPHNNQILEIENVDDVDDLTIFCLVTISIVIGY
jgi:predicted hotdog family 3-hydroxylacyl-ACP dehydratase